MGIKKKVALVVFAPILFLLIFVSNFSGICWTAGKKYSDDELIQKAAPRIFKDNPDCCLLNDKVSSSNTANDFLNRLFGSYFYEIELFYNRNKLRNKSPNDQFYDEEDSYYHEYSIVNQCGKRVDGYGTSIPKEHFYNRIEYIKSHKLKNSINNKALGA